MSIRRADVPVAAILGLLVGLVCVGVVVSAIGPITSAGATAPLVPVVDHGSNSGDPTASTKEGEEEKSTDTLAYTTQRAGWIPGGGGSGHLQIDAVRAHLSKTASASATSTILR